MTAPAAAPSAGDASRRPRILAVTHEMSRTGAPLVLLRLLEWLRDEGRCDIEVLALRDGAHHDAFAAVGPVHLVPAIDPRVWLPPKGSGLDEQPPDVVHDLNTRRVAAARPKAHHLTGFDLLYVNSASSARALRLLPEVPPVVVAHLHELDSAFDLWLDPIDRDLLLERSDLYVVASRGIGRHLEEAYGVAADRVLRPSHELIGPTAADPEGTAEVRATLGLRGDEVVVGAIGTVDWRKGTDLFIQVAARVRRALPDRAVRFLWIGGAAEEAMYPYRYDVTSLDLDGHLTFVGEVSDVPAWIGALDLFCLTSREDPFPLVCLEAGSLGVPVISFANGGMAELAVADGTDDPLLTIVDYLDVEAMAAAVVARVEDADLRTREGSRLRHWLCANALASTGAVDIADALDQLLLPTSGSHHMTSPRRSGDVLIVTPSSVRSTANRCTLAFLGWCRTHVDHPPRMIALAGGELKQEMRDAGVKVVEVPRSTLRTVERVLLRAGQDRAARGVRKVLHRYLFTKPPRPEVILAVSVQGAGPVLRYVHPDTRLVTYCYENGALLDQMIDDEMMTRLVKGTSTWIAASRDIARDLAERGVSPGDITTVRPFIDGPTPDREAAAARRAGLGLGPDDVVVGGIGRSDWRDAPDLFLRAASIITRRHPELPVRFVWVGAPDDGPSRWILDHDVRCAGLSDRFTFTGTPDDGEAWIESFDVLCLTSRLDPPPPAALVSGALGVPLIGFAQEGLQQMADEAGGAPAVHAVPYLDVEAMAEAVASLVADPAQRAAGGEALQDSVVGGRLTVDGAPEVWDVVRTALAEGGRK